MSTQLQGPFEHRVIFLRAKPWMKGLYEYLRIYIFTDIKRKVTIHEVENKELMSVARA